jgi:OOP family OmpA-OmpF porin
MAARRPAVSPTTDLMSRTAAWLLSLLGLLVLTFLCFTVHRGAIEADLSTRAARAISGIVPGLDLGIDGRDVTLRGTVATEGDRQSAEARVAAIPGVRRVLNELLVAGGGAVDNPPLQPFSLLDGPDGLVVRGVVPDASARDAVLSRVRASYPGREITDELTLSPGASGAWIAALDEPLPRFRGVSGTEFVLEPGAGGAGGVIVLRGSVATDADKARMEQAVSEVVRAPYTFRSELIVGAAGPRTEVESADPSDADVQAAQAALREALGIGAVEFNTGTADLTDASRTLLDRAAGVFTRFPRVGAEVQGHTDSQGADAANEALSQRRADAVRAYLVEQGVAAAALTARGYGEAEPVADNETADGRARNRRVVFRLNRL